MEMTETRRPVGRPTKEPQEGERVMLSFRVTPEMKRKLEVAANKSGRSQSQEAELRLEQSFSKEEASESWAKVIRNLEDSNKRMEGMLRLLSEGKG